MVGTEQMVSHVSDGEFFNFEEQNKKVERAIRVVNVLAQQVGNVLPIVPINGIDGLDTTHGVYVLDNERTGEGVTGASFEFTPENLSGAADSAHAVIPGNLIIERGKGEPTVASVVAKCFTSRDFDDRLVRVKREVSIMQQLQKQGELAFNPLAVVMAQVGGEEQIVLLTDYYDEPRLVTLDNNPWGLGMTRGNVESAIVASSAVGRFNRHSIHNDAKIKNAAQDETGKSGMIDFETSLPIDPTNPSEVAMATYTDFGKLLDSLRDRGFFGLKPNGKPAAEIRDALDAMTVSYTDQWVGADELVVEAVWQATKSAIDSALPDVRKHEGYYVI